MPHAKLALFGTFASYARGLCCALACPRLPSPDSGVEFDERRVDSILRCARHRTGEPWYPLAPDAAVCLSRDRTRPPI